MYKFIYMLLILCVFQACSNPPKLNPKWSTWESHTDNQSRELARKTFQNLQKENKDRSLNPGDALRINIFDWGLPDELKSVGNDGLVATFDVVIPQSGIIQVGSFEPFQAAGKSAADVHSFIDKELVKKAAFVQPQVNVIISSRIKTVTVAGAITVPGKYGLDSSSTRLLDMLANAGELTSDAGYHLHVVKSQSFQKPLRSATSKQYSRDSRYSKVLGNISTNNKIITIDLYELLELGNYNLNIVIEDGDMIYVPKAYQFAIEGHVASPGRFSINRPTTLLEAIAEAGGLDEDEASPQCTLLKRTNKYGKQSLYAVDLVAMTHNEIPDIFLRANDVVIVRQNWAKYIYNEVKDWLAFNIGGLLNNN